MKNKFQIIIILLFFSCTQVKEPILKLDLDNLKNQEKKSFIIRNIGTGKLLILDYSSSCNCTLLNIQDSTVIMPYDSLIVPLEISKSEKFASKEITITLRTNTKPQLTSFDIKL